MNVSKRRDNFSEALRRLIDTLRAAGFEEDAAKLRELVFETAWTSSSEMAGEIGLAILRIQQGGRGRLPKDVGRGLDARRHNIVE